jgi:hypothetical protein
MTLRGFAQFIAGFCDNQKWFLGGRLPNTVSEAMDPGSAFAALTWPG